MGQGEGFIGRFDPLGVQGFDGDLVFENGRGQRHFSADDKRLGQFQHDERKACLVQTVSNAGGQIAAAAQNNEVL